MSGSIVPHLRRFLSEISEFEELPHSFDDTLVDRLLEAIDFSDAGLYDFLREQFADELSSASSVVVSFVLQLAEKSCANGNASLLGEELLSFLSSVDSILYQDRPAKVHSDALRLCHTSLPLRDDWSNVLQWALVELPREAVSVFVRIQIENFFIDVRASEVFGKLHALTKIFVESNSLVISNGIARILQKHHEALSAEDVRSLLKRIKTSRGAYQSVFDLGSLLFSRIGDPSPFEELFQPGLWSSEEVRKETVMSSIRSGLPLESLGPAIETVLLSPAIKLHNFVDLIPFISDETFLEHAENIYPSLALKRKSPLTDLIRLLEAATSRFPLSQAIPLLNAVGIRLLESPSLLKSVEKAYGSGCFDEECLLPLRSQLSALLTEAIASPNWDDRDSALEAATIFPVFLPILGDVGHFATEDPSPYVRASALRCLIRQGERTDLSLLCEQILTKDVDHEPRLEAISFLERSLPSSLSSAFRVLPRAIEDPDADVRFAILRISTVLLENEEFSATTRKILEEWLQDPEIGFKVRAVLGESPPPYVQPALHVLEDMFSALNINFDDTIDCY